MRWYPIGIRRVNRDLREQGLIEKVRLRRPGPGSTRHDRAAIVAAVETRQRRQFGEGEAECARLLRRWLRLGCPRKGPTYRGLREVRGGAKMLRAVRSAVGA